MQNLHKKIEIASNIAIICVALLFSGVLLNRYLFSAPSKSADSESQSIKAGANLQNFDVDWGKNDKTLLLVISTTCRYCTESSSFYQNIAKRKRDGVKLIALLPQNVGEAQRYLNERQIDVDEVKQTNLDKINIKGTPTLILVDKFGAVIKSWVGKLPPDKETEVFDLFSG